MDNACRQYINEIARLVRDVYHISTPLVDMEQVIQAMNGRIVVKKDLDTLCDGTVAKEGDSFVIAVPPNETESQRRFTLARIWAFGLILWCGESSRMVSLFALILPRQNTRLMNLP